MAATTTKKTTSRSRTTASKAAPTPAEALRAAGAAASAPEAGAAEKLRKKAFVDRVVIASGMRKREVKPVVEAALRELGKALDEGMQIVLPDLGNLRIANTKETGQGTVHTVKVRRSAPKDDAVAKDADAG